MLHARPSTTQPPEAATVRPRRARGLPLPLRGPRWLRATALTAAALAAACSLPVQSRAPALPDPVEEMPPRPGTAPLPEGWPGRKPQLVPPRPHPGAVPLWGLPAFEAPSASHCSGPQRLREVPGDLRQHEHGLAPAGRFEARSMAKAAEGTGRATAMAEAGVEKGALAAAPAAAPPAPTAAATTADRLGHAEAARDTSHERAAERRDRQPAPGAAAMPPPRQQSPAERVTAGMVDDNADFGEYLNFRQRWAHLGTRDRDVSERYRIEVRDAAGRPAADAEVALSWPGAARAIRFARTDSAGGLWLHPRALVAPWELGHLSRLEVQVRHGDDVARATLQRGQKHAVQLRVDSTAPRPYRQPLDVVFLVDATGSMADEIAKLRDSIRSIADRVQGLPQRPDLCWGLVAYRDRSDAFLTRSHDLTDDLSAFHGHLSRLQAGGGGDYPEALNEALNETVHRLSWRGDGTARLVVLIADAPPHLDYGQPYYDQDSAAALARGIKLHAVGASGLNRQGEAVFRQMAQTTGGKFVFLTYQDARRPGAAPGSQTSHDVRNYSVETLDDLIVKLVTDELGAGGRR